MFINNFKKFVKVLINTLPDESATQIFYHITSLKNFFFTHQRIGVIQIGDYFLKAPKSHVYLQPSFKQPLRDKFIGTIAKFFGEKYKESSFIDIGANVGETAALMASYASNKMILVEVDNYFFSFLKENIKQFKNEIQLEQIFISDGETLNHRMIYEGGSAVIKEDIINTKNAIKSKLIEEISHDKISLIKVDIDGYDLKAILASNHWLKENKPAVVFEFDGIKNKITEVDKLLNSLFSIDYKYFIVWDDAGYKLIATSTKSQIKDLCLYVKQNFVGEHLKRIWDLNILCIPTKDQDLFEKINNYTDKLIR